ncbi:MAG TPA: FG-GAP-like repeat-containing protein [Pirellulales bacterium]|nr:FG-GAP-like repeat-containing protein [Pirellulales bacterium]
MSFSVFCCQSQTQDNVRRSNHRHALRRPRFETFEDRRMLSFTPASTYPVGDAPQAVVTADFNDDGQLDLATAIAGSNSVSVLLGNEDGTFQAALSSTTDATPLSLAVGDFNADGKLDIATANSSNVSVLLGNGNGTFQSPTSVGIVGTPSSVAVGDVNGDGMLDLGVTSNAYYRSYSYNYYYYGYNQGRANVLLGNGDGSFDAPVASLEYGYLGSATLTDFNADGKLDFAAAIQDLGYVVVLPGTGTGSFGAATYSYSSYIQSMAAGDVNDDGQLDLVTVSQYSDKVGVLLGTGTGSFATPQYYNDDSYPSSVALGDFNGDGDLDIATANLANNDVRILRGLGDGAFSRPEQFAAGPGAYAVAAGDFNGDGWLDVATTNLSGASASVLLNNQSWPELPPVSVSVSDASVTEGKKGVTYMTFTVNLSGTDSAPVTVRYATQDGTATARSDYQSQSGTLTFAPGETTKTITVLVKGDKKSEADESFFVNLSNAKGALLDDDQGEGTILNDDRVRQNWSWFAFDWDGLDDAMDDFLSPGRKRRGR